MYNEARALLDMYASTICHLHHIIYMPTFRRIIEGVYLAVSRKEPVNTDHAALMLAVFSTVLCYTKWIDPSDLTDPIIAEVGEDKESVFMLWFRAALDLIDHSRRALAGSLEIVQACIILLFLDCSLEGLTSRSRAVLAQGLHCAREISLHRLDCPAAVRGRASAASPESGIDTEIKRRVWWHIVATDWYEPSSNGL